MKHPIKKSIKQSIGQPIKRLSLGLGTNPHTSGLEFQVATIQEGKTKAQLLTVGGSNDVSDWFDYSSNGKHLAEITSSKRPIFTPNSINGLPEFIFDGTDDTLGSAITTILARTVFIVGTVGAGFSTLAGIFGEVGTDTTTIRMNGTNSAFRGNAPNTNAGDFTDGGEMRIDGVVSDEIVIGRPFIMFAESATTETLLMEISDASGGLGRFWKGGVGEVLVYGDVLTSIERDGVLGYLSAKWGVPLLG